MVRPRFSLRGLSTVTALLAGFCYWRDLPRQNAKRFFAMIEAGDHDGIDAMLSGDRGEVRSASEGLGLGWDVRHLPQRPADWLAGRCYVDVIKQVGSFSLVNRISISATGATSAGRWGVEE